MSSSFRHQIVLVASLIVLLPGVTSAQLCVPAPVGLVGWWPAEGNPSDAVAGNDGVMLGDTTFVSGIVGQGFKFDGVGDGVQIPDAAAMKPAATIP